MKRRPSFFYFIGLFIATLVLAVLLFVFDYWKVDLVRIVNSNINQIKNIYTTETKYFLQSTTDSLVNSILSQQKSVVSEFEKHIKSEDLLYRIAASEFAEMKNRNLAKQNIVKKLRSISDKSPFISYFILNSSGEDLITGKQIPKGLFKKMSDVSYDESGKFVKLRWIDGEESEVYVRKFPYFKWLFITVLKTGEIKRAIQFNFIDLIKSYRFGRNNEGYMFAISIGKNSRCRFKMIASSLTASDRCVDLERLFNGLSVKKLLSEGSMFIMDGKNNRDRLVFFRYVKSWNWIVGSGITLRSVSLAVGRQKEKIIFGMGSNIEDLTVFLFGVGIVIIAVSFAFVEFSRRKTYGILKLLNESLSKGEPLKFDEPVFKEFEIIINYFSEALDRINTYENDFLKAFVSILEARDVYTKGHSQRVAFYSKMIAKKLGYDEKHQDEIYRAGLLHDIGKVGIPDAVLLKPGKLTDNEYRIMQQHPIISYEILARSQRFKHLALWARQHHEKCDGSGYPDGLKCSAITEEARIIEIADIFDALTTTRPYRKAFSVEKAVEILSNEKIDKEIFSVAKGVLIDAIKEVGDVEVEFMSEQLDRIRNELFNYDFMTGLKVWLSFRKTLQDFINVDAPFVVYRVNIKNISRINYRFGEDIGDEVIVKTAEALKKFKKAEEMFSQDLICRAYADVFFMARRIKKNELMPSFEEESSTIKSYLMEEVFSYLFEDSRINFRIEGIEDYLDFEVTFARYPFDGRTLNEIIYRVESVRKVS
ncbi:HD domain-containing phosphohydrolase [Hippea alviniae]|uniref:HD domain-containing phosphohydrolase n=1 Tax=Hippea alviniae TaxID=1279027 RepID=UPI0003B76758|nr:HD domain-containing phosphohydrolase [Hippea alviniae]